MIIVIKISISQFVWFFPAQKLFMYLTVTQNKRRHHFTQGLDFYLQKSLTKNLKDNIHEL